MNQAQLSELTPKRLSQYYTSSVVSRFLIGCFRQTSVRTAIELGAGEGSLIRAAQDRWPEVQFVSVDIDPRNAPSPRSHGRNHFVGDALVADLPTRIGMAPASADLAVCNPPFTPPVCDARYSSIIARAGLPVARAASFGSDALFIAQNLWMLREGGELGVIVPAGFVAGSKSRAVREALLAQHSVHQVVELPPGAFAKTEVRTYLMCLRKGGVSNRPIRLGKLDMSGVELSPIWVSPEDAAARMDFSFHANDAQCRKRSSVESEIQVARGSIGRAEALRANLHVLHSTDISARVLKWPSHSVGVAPKGMVAGQAGDVLMARVGRNFHQKVGILESDGVLLSDCVFAIRSHLFSPDDIVRALLCELGQKWLSSRSRGACARYMTKEDLKVFPLGEILKWLD